MKLSRQFQKPLSAAWEQRFQRYERKFKRGYEASDSLFRERRDELKELVWASFLGRRLGRLERIECLNSRLDYEENRKRSDRALIRLSRIYAYWKALPARKRVREVS